MSSTAAKRALALATGVLVAVPLVAAVQLTTAPQRADAATTEVEAPDFASEAYADAWDYNDAADQNTNSSNARSASVGGGKLNLSVTGGEYFDPVWHIDGSLPNGRDGLSKPVDTTRYKRVSFDMNQPSSGVGALYWFTCPQLTLACAGGITFGITPGDHVYDKALNGASTIGAKKPWTGKVYGLRMIPTVSGSTTKPISVSIDWLRVYAPTTAHAAYPPGTYSGFTVTSIPQPVIDSPSPADGQDVTVSQGRRQWDFTSAANAAGVRVSNATVKSYDSRGMTATNGGAHPNDPQLALPISAFSASKFHYLSFDLAYDGPFSLSGSPGGGKLARLVWNVSGTTTQQESNDIVTYAGANGGHYALDLNQGTVLDENSRAPRVGWAGQTVTGLRFDPNEDPGANTWHLKDIHLRTDPTAAGSYTVKYHDAAWVAGTTAQILVGTGGQSTYQTIGSNVAVAKGSNSFAFNLGNRAPGSYRVQIVLRHPAGGAALANSSARVVMSRDASHDPVGRVESLIRVPGGAQISGWAFDKDTTKPISVRVYNGATSLATSTTTIARPDVKRAYPAASANSGYKTTLKLAAGSRSICAYGLNTGSGRNSTLGCKTISIDPRPIGRLDVAKRSGTAVSLSGWALDPDTAASISVRFYVNGKYVGASTAGGYRSDIAHAYPGYGAAHGYTATVRGAAGSTVCAYGIDSSGKANTTLGCKKV